MFSRILTAYERRKIQKFLSANGKKANDMRTIVWRANRYLPTIEQDLALIRRLLAAYEKS
jgi:hypothetical protein